ncbi:MAG: methyltransferase domain-containing protein [Fimbriimonadaceae bacterium]|nr:methyltransferase domain-containing protein [Fimbriimonadaceae bacterium]
MASFGPIAPHYDVLMANVPYDMWAGYYRLLLATIEHQPDRLLDVCCGTGNVAELMVEAGYEVVGFDIAPGMVDAARRKAAEKGLDIGYHVADARTVDLGQTFDGAFSFFDSLNYVADLDGFRAAVDRVAKHLEPGGSFIFDLNTSYAFEEAMFDQVELRRNAKIRYQWKGDYDPSTRVIHVDMTFWRDGEEIHETHVQRAHSDEEVRQALADAGFTQVRAFESYTLDPPRKRSDRVHYAALLPG